MNGKMENVSFMIKLFLIVENVIKVTLHVKVSLIKQKNILSCPFHSLAYEIKLLLPNQSKLFIMS